ncbi:hypothetical protein HG530_001270 [Fusarium avenaceum]|nr:hypothetical protein HG530_001270 [Fusarium avenaceum]
MSSNNYFNTLPTSPGLSSRPVCTGTPAAKLNPSREDALRAHVADIAPVLEPIDEEERAISSCAFGVVLENEG